MVKNCKIETMTKISTGRGEGNIIPSPIKIYSSIVFTTFFAYPPTPIKPKKKFILFLTFPPEVNRNFTGGGVTSPPACFRGGLGHKVGFLAGYLHMCLLVVFIQNCQQLKNKTQTMNCMKVTMK